jgi:hypothetical protein
VEVAVEELVVVEVVRGGIDARLRENRLEVVPLLKQN